MILCLPFSLLSYLIRERKARRILSLAALLIIILVAILGFGFSYFKIDN
jgi:formate hydrogenlyase subunit 3/multisubunit Na+/H+ antiporter MnhD subunit